MEPIRTPMRFFRRRERKLASQGTLEPAFDIDELVSLFPELSEHREEISSSTEAFHDVRPGEKVVGTVSGQFQQWLIKCQSYYARRAAEGQVRAKFSSDELSKAEAIDNFARYDQQADTVRELMWLAIKMELGLWHGKGGGLSIRKGWKVVEVPKPDPRQFIEHFFAGDDD